MYTYLLFYFNTKHLNQFKHSVSNLSETMAWMLTGIDLKISGMHRLVIINRHTKFHINVTVHPTQKVTNEQITMLRDGISSLRKW